MGYYVQSLALQRLLTEYLGLVWYIKDHRDEADDWLDPEKKPRHEAGEMLRAVFADDATASGKMLELRKTLHGFARQGPLAIASLYDDASPERFTIRLGPDFHEPSYRGSAYMLVVLTGLSLHAFMTWIERKTGQNDWSRGVADYCERVFSEVDRLNVEWGVPMSDDESTSADRPAP